MYVPLLNRVVSRVAMVAPGPPWADVVSTFTFAGFDAGQYETVPCVRVTPAPSVIGTDPVTVCPLNGPPIHPGDAWFDGVGVGDGIGVGVGVGDAGWTVIPT